MTIGLYFGTQTGKTETVCGIIKEQLGDAVANAKDVTESDLADFAGFDGLICGIPTWNTGAEELRSGTAWDDLLEKIGALDLSKENQSQYLAWVTLLVMDKIMSMQWKNYTDISKKQAQKWSDT